MPVLCESANLPMVEEREAESSFHCDAGWLTPLVAIESREECSVEQDPIIVETCT